MRTIIEHNARCHVYRRTNNANTIKKKRYALTIDRCIRRLEDEGQEERTLLQMPEWCFEYASYTIECTSKTPFTVRDLKVFLRDKKEHLSWSKWVQLHGMTHTVLNQRVEWGAVQSLLWKTWDIAFDLNLFIPKPDLWRCIVRETWEQRFSKRYWKQYRSIVPQHLWISRVLLTRLQQSQWVIMHIGLQETMIMHFARGTMMRYETVPLWERLLISCYKEHAIEQYMYGNYAEVERNSLLKKLTQESLTFYCHQLAQRMSTQTLWTHPILLLTNISKNPLFIPTLQEEYRNADWQGVIMPVNSLYQMPDYWSRTYANDACAHAVLVG